MFIEDFSKLVSETKKNTLLDSETIQLIEIAIQLCMGNQNKAKHLMMSYKNNGGSQDNIDAVLALITAASIPFINTCVANTGTCVDESDEQSSCCSQSTCCS